MIKFDGDEMEWTDAGAGLQLSIGSEKEGKRSVSWSIWGRLCSVVAPIRRGDFEDARFMDFILMGKGCEIDRWQELSGAVNEGGGRAAYFQFESVMLLRAEDADGPPLESSNHMTMSMAHHFEIGVRKDWHFLVEGGALFLPNREAAPVIFGSREASEQVLRALTQQLDMLDTLPLARVAVAVPADAADRIALAREIARTRLGLDELVPWPGSAPDFQWQGPPPQSVARQGQVHFATPWARDEGA